MRARSAQWIGAGLATVWMLGVVVADAVVTSDQVVLAVFFAVAPLIACAVLSMRHTAVFAVAAVALSAASGAWNHTWDTAQQYIYVTDVALVSMVALAVAVVRVRRERSHARVVAIGEIAQRAILPTLPQRAGALRVASRYVSAAEDALVGGDFYDLYRSDARVRIIVGDVRGKGIGAVEHAARVIRAFRQSASAAPDLTAVAKEMDEYLRPFFGEEEFATALLVHTADDRNLTLVNCGHDLPLLKTPRGVAPISCEAGLPLGLGPTSAPYDTTWEPGDRLLLYTDGLVEARNARGEFLAVEAVAACLDRPTIEEALDAVLATVRAHAGGRLNDDLALMLIENVGSLT